MSADPEHRQRLDVVKREVNRHRHIRTYGLLTILAFLVVVGPLLGYLDDLSIASWRKVRLAGSEAVTIPGIPIRVVVVEHSARRMLVSDVGGGVVILPVVASAPAASGTTRIAAWTPGELRLEGAYPCFERGSAGILRLLGRPSLSAPDGGKCTRVDGRAFDSLFTHTDRETWIEFR